MRESHLLLIDPQNDFCNPKGALFVTGADADMGRLASFITKNRKRIAEIQCTLDNHQAIHIAHPSFWVNSKGEHPAPFTPISVENVENGVWMSRIPHLQQHALNYVQTLAKNGRYSLFIWPEHCLIGSWGCGVVPEVSQALYDWERTTVSLVRYTVKGSNFLTEHYSGIMADVPDDTDPTTKLNTDIIDALSSADDILITGEALSHCVKFTVTDIADKFGVNNIQKFILLQDTSSSVSGFEVQGSKFVTDMVKRGMRITTTADW